MRTIMKTVLLLAVLCLAGCSGDDPQSVAFSESELSVGSESETLIVSVYANCPWKITENSDLIEINQTQGTGDITVTVRILQNNSYDELAHQITITSEDGTSFDSLIINQQPTRAIQIDQPDMIPEEGGTFTMPVRTNDEITDVYAPDWIAFVSSRGLTGYTFTFTAEPNKTGKQRKGYIELLGSLGARDGIQVKQDSYAPISVSFEDFPSYSIATGFWRMISIEPEYADYSKLEVFCPERGSAKIDNYDGYLLSVVMPEYGKYPIYICAGNDTLFHATPECLPRNPLSGNNNPEAYVGQNSGVAEWTYKSDLYTLESSDISVIRVVDNRDFEAVGVGTAVISAGIPGTDVHSKKTVKVERFAVNVQIGQLEQLEDGTYNATFTALVRGPKGMKISDFAIKDNAGTTLFTNEGEVKASGSDGYIIRTPKANIDFDRETYSSINSFLACYKFVVTVELEGNSLQREVQVNGYTVSEF